MCLITVCFGHTLVCAVGSQTVRRRLWQCGQTLSGYLHCSATHCQHQPLAGSLALPTWPMFASRPCLNSVSYMRHLTLTLTTMSFIPRDPCKQQQFLDEMEDSWSAELYDSYPAQPVSCDTNRSRAHLKLSDEEDNMEKELASHVKYRAIYDDRNIFVTFQPFGTPAELDAYHRRRERRSSWMKTTKYIHLDEFTGSEHDSDTSVWHGEKAKVRLTQLRQKIAPPGSIFSKRPGIIDYVEE